MSPTADTEPTPAGTTSAAPVHPASHCWTGWLAQVQAVLARSGADPRRTVVLVPYAQLMAEGRRAWSRVHPSGFMPRFVSTRHWAAALQPFVPGPTDLSMDMALDSLVAAVLLDRVAPAHLEPALRSVMVSRLVEAARQLAPLAAAVPPDERLAWAAPLRDALLLGTPSLQWESMLASLALTWASTSAYATDVLWGPQAAAGTDADALVVLHGYQHDPLASALAARWGDRATAMDLRDQPDAVQLARPRLHACGDAEDEAQRATACVMAQIGAGRVPVALVANDRLQIRRVSAMLDAAGLSVCDETGWKLSTTHVGAQAMSLLRAADPRAGMDDVIDLLKQASVWTDAQVQALEQQARADGVARWRSGLASARIAALVPPDLPALLEALQPARSLAQWLADLRQGAQQCGFWAGWLTDPAGVQMLQTLRLHEGAAQDVLAVQQALAPTVTSSRSPGRPTATAARLSLAGFTAWVRDVLEGASYIPSSTGEAPVVILPLAQLLGRRFAATVVPGCDEQHLNPSPELPGQWTAAQRDTLGLPSRELLAHAAQQAWQTTLCAPELDLLWRTQERGEAIQASPWVQVLMSPQASLPGLDPRPLRRLHPQATERPAASAPDTLPQRLSASAYQDLRDCPYRFFALRQLRLSDAPELQAEPDQRDMGNWLHAVLSAFHTARGDQRPGVQADRQALDRLAIDTAASMGLNAGEGGAGFLPYQAVWPGMREGYLSWLAEFENRAEQAGARFLEGEVAKTAQAGAYQLVGQLDRVDLHDSPHGPVLFVIDYKTESRSRTHERVKEPLEDTQLAFYAALLPEGELRAAYLSISDQRGDGPRDKACLLIEQPDVMRVREPLLQGIQHDMDRIQAGQPMTALGEGRVCDFCAARGLCRKDFWGPR